MKNAATIYKQARHPKSFITLDGADHLLSDKKDSLYVGNMVAHWASRYLDTPDDEEISSESQVLTRTGEVGYVTDILAGKHHLLSDEPSSVGGTDLGPTPYDLLLSSLGACNRYDIAHVCQPKEVASEGNKSPSSTREAPFRG